MFKKSLFTVYFANFPYCTAKYNVLSDALRLSQVLNSAGVCGVPTESMVWIKHPEARRQGCISQGFRAPLGLCGMV